MKVTLMPLIACYPSFFECKRRCIKGRYIKLLKNKVIILSLVFVVLLLYIQFFMLMIANFFKHST